jgi:ATP-dependent helicase IRC3
MHAITAESSSNPFFAEWSLKECRAARSKKVPAPHQKAALAQLNKWYSEISGDSGGILVLPTGGGKTFTAVHFLCNGPLSDGYKVLWLAHTHHLLEQAHDSFDSDALGHIREPRQVLRLRVVSGTSGHYPPRDIRPSDDVIIATLQTVTTAHREKLAQLRDFIDSADGKLFVVFDEAHHAPAPSYRKLLLDLREDGAPALGLTATPTYTDETKKGWLKKLFPQGILGQAKVSDLIAQQILAKPHFERAPTSCKPDFDDAEYQKWLGTYRDVPEHIIDHLARNKERNAFIASTYADNRGKYGKTIIFTDRWYQCEAIVEALAKRKVKADAVYSHVDARIASVEGRRKRGQDDNARALARFRNTEIDVLVNVRMLTEGTDIPDAKTVFLTRQTTSQILLTQMVGRALRGPKFGGTPDAYIVSFVDDWQQSIRWAEYDPLTEDQADDEVRISAKRPPLQLISIDLVKRLAKQMDSGVNINPGPFTSLIPAGWYRVVFDATVADTEDIEPCDQLVMVFDDERKGFERLITDLLKDIPAAFGDETASFERERARLDAWRAKYLAAVARSDGDLLYDIFNIARHIGQGHGAPEFFPFEVRRDHDLDVVAKTFIEKGLSPRSIQECLRAEFERKDRFWRALFPRFDHFRSSYDACQARILFDGASDAEPQPRGGPEPSFAEPDEEVKEQVKRRDGNRCLACGATKLLTVDHIVPIYHGGSNHTDNLQTLCRICNTRKATRTIRFTVQQTPLTVAPTALEAFDHPPDPGDRGHWERFLRQTINFTYQCSAVSEVAIGGKGDGYYNWEIELVRGNPAQWIKPHLPRLFERIQEARRGVGKPEITSLTINVPGEPPLRAPMRRK